MKTVTEIMADGQVLAESRMTDTCLITRASTTGDVLDPVTGLPVTGARVTVYSGKCRVRTGGAVSAGSLRQSAGDVVTQVASILHVPVNAARVMVDDRVVVSSSVSPTLPALTFTVSGLVPGSQMTSQRVQVTAVIN